jgi:hypothetical protein
MMSFLKIHRKLGITYVIYLALTLTVGHYDICLHKSLLQLVY